MEIDGELQTWTHDLISTHFSHAVTLYCESKHLKHPITKNGYYISSIIHAVSAIEACVGRIAYQIFEDKTSPYFLPLESRDIPLKRMIASWFNIQTVEKINLFLSLSLKTTLDKSLEAKFRELNSLRNWLVHGFCYDSTYLFKESDGESFELIDREDSVDWNKKFPINKFNSISEINDLDAKKALVISLDILKILSCSNNVGVLIFLEKSQKVNNIMKEDTQIESLIYDIDKRTE